MRGEVHILVYCPIDTLQWGSTHSALVQSRGRVSHYFEMQGLTRETKDKKDRFFILQFESLDWHKCFYHFRPQLFS